MKIENGWLEVEVYLVGKDRTDAATRSELIVTWDEALDQLRPGLHLFAGTAVLDTASLTEVTP